MKLINHLALTFLAALALCGTAAGHTIVNDSWAIISGNMTGSSVVLKPKALPENITLAGISSLSFSTGSPLNTYFIGSTIPNEPTFPAIEYFYNYDVQVFLIASTPINASPSFTIGFGYADYPSCAAEAGQTASVTVNGTTYTAKNPCGLASDSGDLTFVNGVLQAGTGVGWTVSPSLSGTTIPSSTQIVDMNLNIWSLSSGVAYENGQPTPSSGVILLLCYGGVVYQENSHHLWWLWDINTNTWAASTDPRMISPAGTTIPVATQIVDSGLNMWTLSGGQAYQHGQLTPSSGVILLLYAKGLVYQENSHHNWWYWHNGAWIATSAPLTPSASGTAIPNAAEIIDNGRNIWKLSGGKAYENNAVTPSSGVILLLFYGGNVYQENAHHDWLEWNGQAWIANASDPRAGQPLAYVASSTGGKNSVTVIDTGTNRVKATIPIGFEASYMAVTPDAKHVYVAGNSINNYDSVAVIGTAQESVLTSIRVQYDPHGVYDPQGIVASPDGKRVYVVYAAFVDPSSNNGQFQTSTVSTIDTATNKVVASVTLPDYNSSIAISPNGKTLYLSAFDSCGCASQQNSAFIDVVDTVSNSLVSDIGFPEPPVDGSPVVGGSNNFIYSAVLSPNDAKLYSNYSYDYETANSAGYVDEVAVFNPVTGAQTKSIPAVFLAQVFSPDSKHLYGVGLGGVGVINTATEVSITAVANIPGASDLGITPDGKHLYITDASTHSVFVADTATYTISTVIPVPISSSGAIAIVPAH